MARGFGEFGCGPGGLEGPPGRSPSGSSALTVLLPALNHEGAKRVRFVNPDEAQLAALAASEVAVLDLAVNLPARDTGDAGDVIDEVAGPVLAGDDEIEVFIGLRTGLTHKTNHGTGLKLKTMTERSGFPDRKYDPWLEFRPYA